MNTDSGRRWKMRGWQLFLKWHILMMATGKWGMTKTTGWRGCVRWTWAVGPVEVSVRAARVSDIWEHTMCTALSALKGLTHAVKQQHNLPTVVVQQGWGGRPLHQKSNTSFSFHYVVLKVAPVTLAQSPQIGLWCRPYHVWCSWQYSWLFPELKQKSEV